MTITTKKTVSNIYDLEKICWAGALTRVKRAIEDGYGDELYNIVQEYCCIDSDEVEDVVVNDFIWFGSDDILREWGVLKDEDEEQEDED